eukprot:6145273-Pyramimonas_sp.AAC.1
MSDTAPDVPSVGHLSSPRFDSPFAAHLEKGELYTLEEQEEEADELEEDEDGGAGEAGEAGGPVERGVGGMGDSSEEGTGPRSAADDAAGTPLRHT